MTKIRTAQIEIEKVFISLIVANSEISWPQIVCEIKKTQKIKNWLSVRGIMQTFINAGILCRTNDLNVEIYICSK